MTVRKLIYSLNMSLDGYVEDASGGLDWTIVDEEIHQFFNDQEREFELSLYGRRLYETMYPHWSTALQDPDLKPVEKEYAQIWNAVPKIVFSRTLDHVEGNATLMRDGLIEEVTKLKSQPGKWISVGGATLAASLVEAGLVDEYRIVIHPVILGGGKPFFPNLKAPTNLTLLDTRRFSSGAMYLRYVRADSIQGDGKE
jgi:dihydrofolate reductase